MILINQANGLQILIKIVIGLMTLMASFSGKIMAKRFGIKSANNINREVTVKKDKLNPMVSAQGPG